MQRVNEQSKRNKQGKCFSLYLRLYKDKAGKKKWMRNKWKDNEGRSMREGLSEGVNEREQNILLQTWDIADKHQSVDHPDGSCDYCPSHLIDLPCVTSFYISFVEGRLILEFKTKSFYAEMRKFHYSINVMPKSLLPVSFATAIQVSGTP